MFKRHPHPRCCKRIEDEKKKNLKRIGRVSFNHAHTLPHTTSIQEIDISKIKFKDSGGTRCTVGSRTTPPGLLRQKVVCDGDVTRVTPSVSLTAQNCKLPVRTKEQREGRGEGWRVGGSLTSSKVGDPLVKWNLSILLQTSYAGRVRWLDCPPLTFTLRLCASQLFADI